MIMRAEIFRHENNDSAHIKSRYIMQGKKNLPPVQRHVHIFNQLLMWGDGNISESENTTFAKVRDTTVEKDEP